MGALESVASRDFEHSSLRSPPTRSSAAPTAGFATIADWPDASDGFRRCQLISASSADVGRFVRSDRSIVKLKAPELFGPSMVSSISPRTLLKAPVPPSAEKPVDNRTQPMSGQEVVHRLEVVPGSNIDSHYHEKEFKKPYFSVPQPVHYRG